MGGQSCTLKEFAEVGQSTSVSITLCENTRLENLLHKLLHKLLHSEGGSEFKQLKGKGKKEGWRGLIGHRFRQSPKIMYSLNNIENMGCFESA